MCIQYVQMYMYHDLLFWYILLVTFIHNYRHSLSKYCMSLIL